MKNRGNAVHFRFLSIRSNQVEHLFQVFSWTEQITAFACNRNSPKTWSLLSCHRFLLHSINWRLPLFVCLFEPVLIFGTPDHCPWCVRIQHWTTGLYSPEDVQVLYLLFTFMFVLKENAVNNYGFQPFLGFTLHNLSRLLTVSLTATPLFLFFCLTFCLFSLWLSPLPVCKHIIIPVCTPFGSIFHFNNILPYWHDAHRLSPDLDTHTHTHTVFVLVRLLVGVMRYVPVHLAGTT